MKKLNIQTFKLSQRFKILISIVLAASALCLSNQAQASCSNKIAEAIKGVEREKEIHLSLLSLPVVNIAMTTISFMNSNEIDHMRDYLRLVKQAISGNGLELGRFAENLKKRYRRDERATLAEIAKAIQTIDDKETACKSDGEKSYYYNGIYDRVYVEIFEPLSMEDLMMVIDQLL